MTVVDMSVYGEGSKLNGSEHTLSSLRGGASHFSLVHVDFFPQPLQAS